MGKKRQPIYKVVAADERSPRDGKFIEAIGLYNPKTNPSTVEIDQERALYWLNVGAQPTTTVKNLLSGEGVLYKKELTAKGLGEDEISAAMEEWQNKKEAKSEAARTKAEKAKAEKEKAKAKELEEAKAKELEEAQKKAQQEAQEAQKAEQAEAETEEPKAEENSSDEDKKE